MKNMMKRTILGVSLVMATGIATGQKKNETNAAMEYQSYEKAMMMQNMDNAKKSLLSAIGYIDEAAANPETKESVKTLYYKGKIYLAASMIGMMDKDERFAKYATEQVAMEGITSLKTAYKLDDKARYRDDIKMMAVMTREQAIREGVNKFQSEDYETAMSMFETSAMMYDVIGQTDSLAIYNMALAADRSKNFEKAFEYYDKAAQIGYNVPVSYTLATLALREQKKNTEALEYVKKARTKFPNDKDLILQMVNISLDAGDNETAEKSLEEAIAKDPRNPQLWVAVGMVYEQLGKSEQAEKALLKGVELDPKSENGNYSLGAHYVNLAAAQFEEASKMKLNDPNYEGLKAQSAANYEKAIPFLEKTLEINPNNVEVLNTLFRLYRQLGNSEKALEYKKRIDASKQ